MVNTDVIRDVVARRSTQFALGAEFCTIDELTPQERDTLPATWSAILTAAPDAAIATVLEQWRTLCPHLPVITDALERSILGMGLVRARRRFHPTHGDSNSPANPSSEIALMYMLREVVLDDVPFQAWFGWPPYSGSKPFYWTSLEPVTGSLTTEFHDGFVDGYRSGIVPIADHHTVLERWGADVQFLDADDQPIPADQRPDPANLIVCAEHAGHLAFAIDAAHTDGRGWADTYDDLKSVDSAQVIDEFVGEIIGDV